MLDDILNEVDLGDFDLDWGIEENTTSYIDDLMENEFATKKVEFSEFSVSFVFDIKYKEKMYEFIRNHGKEEICKNIIKFMEEYDA